MKHEDFSRRSYSESSDWGSVKDIPFAGGYERNSLEDDRYYKAPEYKQDTQDTGVESARNMEAETAARHRRKLIGILDWKANQANLNLDNPNSIVSRQFKALLTRRDNQDLTPDLEESILKDLKDGIIGKTDERWLLENIASPVGKFGPEAVFNGLKDRHEQRLLAAFTNVGFNHYRELDSQAVTDFMTKYPTPLDFETKADTFILKIGQKNGNAKEREYQNAKESFMRKIYGKRYEYHRTFQELQEEARDLPKNPEIRGENLSANTGYAGLSKRMLRSIYNWLDQKAEKNPGMTDQEYNKTLRNAILDYRNENLDASEDSVLIDEENQVYGIFDGAGGVEGGRAASRIASRVAETITSRFQVNRGRNLADTLTLASGSLVRAKRNGEKIGITTGALVKILNLPDGERKLAYASAGDSRIYVVHTSGEADQIVQDEGTANVISNYLGPSSNRVFNDAGIMYHDHVTGKNENVTQYGEYPLTQGDRIVLCSDGITGDRGTDLMSNQEMAYYVQSARTPKEAAEALLTHARKFDDRSVIVVNAYPKQTKLNGFLDRLFGKN